MKPVSALRTLLVLNVVVTVAAMSMAYRALHRADDSERLVIRSHQTLQAAEATLLRVVDAQAWERAYRLTRDADDLATFNRTVPQAGAPLEQLVTILREDGRGTDAERLRAEVAAALADFERMVEHTRTGGSIDPPTRAVARSKMEAARATIQRIRQAESDVLTARLQADASAGRWVNWLALIMTGLAAALLTTLVVALVFLARPGIWRV